MKKYQGIVGMCVVLFFGILIGIFGTKEPVKIDSCLIRIGEVRNKLNSKFNKALEEREIRCSQWSKCQKDIIQANTIKTLSADRIGVLEASLDTCESRVSECYVKLTNFMYKK